MSKVVISQKTTLHAQHTFFVHFLAVVLHDCNVKLPNYTFYGRNVVCVPVRLFFLLPLIFSLVAVSISFLLTTNIKLSCFSSCSLFFISCSGSFSVVHIVVDIKI